MLFFLVGMLYDRRHTREIAAFGGIRRLAPLLAAFFLIAAFSSAALPLTNGFVGEYLVLQGAYVSSVSGPVYAAVGALGMVLSAVYMLWLFQRVFAGKITHAANEGLPDVSFRERFVLVPLVAMIFWLGCYVAPWARPADQLARSLSTRAGPLASDEGGPAMTGLIGSRDPEAGR
jgi:NADH-quinone oxidoreductase subunit M